MTVTSLERVARDRAERRHVLGARLERATRQVAVLARRGIETAIDGAAHVEVELVRRPRARRALAVDPELLEVPRAGGDLGNARRPHAVGAARQSP